MHNSSYLIVPVCNEGIGTGHLRRMISLYRDLKKSSPVSIFIPLTQIPEIHKNLLDNGVEQDDIVISDIPENGVWDFIIVDYRSIPHSLIYNLLDKGFLIGIDEGSKNRKYFNYLIDIIPSLETFISPNISSTGLMDLPERREYRTSFLHKKILISFGGEDPAGLTGIVLKFIKDHNYFSGSELTITGNINIEQEKYSQSVKILNNQKKLKDILKNFDLIITSFGLTAFESLASGVPFILLNSSAYHQKLSEKCGFFDIGIKKPNKKKLEQFINTGQNYKDIQKKYIPEEYTNLKDLILSINKTNSICPVCHYNCNSSDIVDRFKTRNFYTCPDCRITFQENFLSHSDSYKKEYFFEDYKKQYGRTYLEDFESIQKLAVGRIKIIDSIISSPGTEKRNPYLLDVGCAYGPFLAESSKHGYTPAGVEIIPEAAEYIRSQFGFHVFTGSFEDAVFEKTFDVVTMWYVIEHFTEPGEILSKVNRLIKPGGVFAFSTPNSAGISARKKMFSFLNNSPVDHITIWNPKISFRVLKRYGFKIKRIRITGHHPERFSGKSGIKSKSGYKIVKILSRLFRLGDTFEVYAVKVKEIDV